jgi:hypothetical protein
MINRPKRRLFVLVLIALAIFPSCVYCQTSRRKENSCKLPASSAYIRKSDGAMVTDNHVFEFAHVLEKGSFTDLLLHKNVRNEHIDGREETIGHVEVEAFSADGQERRWNLKHSGNDGIALAYQGFYRVSEWGCCDWPTIDWYFNLNSGKKLYVSNDELTEVIGYSNDDRRSRWVAFGVYAHGNTPPVVQYGSEIEVLQRYSLLSPRQYYDRPKVFVTDGNVLQKSLSVSGRFNFAVVLKYQDGLELRIPVENDKLLADKASLPQGYSLRQESSEWPPSTQSPAPPRKISVKPSGLAR